MIVIVDYGMGNVGSVKNALRVLGEESKVTYDPNDFARASHCILPGVGSFCDGMKNLRERNLPAILEREIFRVGKPFLGICLGMQLLAEYGEEGGGEKGLGVVSGVVRRFRIDENQFRLPHVGWDDVSVRADATLFRGVESPVFYFVHSFVLDGTDPAIIAGTCDYGEVVPVALEKENIFAVQFHPEKSQKDGLTVLKNFISL